LNEKSFGQIVGGYQKIREDAMRTRDKKIVKEIKKLEKDYEKKLAKLEKESEKTMDPKLRREWKQAEKEHDEFIDKIFSELN